MGFSTAKSWNTLERMEHFCGKLLERMEHFGTDKKTAMCSKKYAVSSGEMHFWNGWNTLEPTLLELRKKYIKVVINRKNRRDKNVKNIWLSVPFHPFQGLAVEK